ncbi:LacI family DNA-binding transcriptional regulator [soil metagenome]
MSDIARVAGVSISTVSHVINQTRPVAAATENAVHAAMAQLGYVSSRQVRAQRLAGSHTIGVALSSITNPYFGEVVGALERSATAAGYTILLADTHDQAGGEFRAVSDLATRRVDAILLAPSPDPAPSLRVAQDNGVPVILIDREGPEEFDQVVVSSAEPTARLVDHLAEIGHVDIGMILPLRGLSTTEQRLEGYRTGLERNGLTYRDELVISGEGTLEPARVAIGELLEAPRKPTAVVVGNNHMTIGVMAGLRDRGLSVPEDIAVVAFDDFPWAEFFQPRLTVIAQPTQVIASEALRMTLARIAVPGRPAEKLVLQPTLVHRESCGCTAAAAVL